MTTAAFTALLWSALAGVNGTAVDWQVGGRAETAAGASFREGSATQQVAVDVVPRISLLLDHRTLRLALRYEPQLRVARDFAVTGLDARVGHGGMAGAEWDVDPVWRVSATVRASVRLVDYGSPVGAGIAGLLDLRAATVVRHLDTGVSAGVEGRPTRRIAVASSVAADSSAGLGADGRAVIPLMRKMRVAGSVARDQTRKDVLRLDAAAVAAEFDAGDTASLATVTGGWAREATKRLRLRLAAGVSGARNGSDPARGVPEAQVALEYMPALLGGPLRAAAAIRHGAAVDRWTAGVQERLGVEGDLSWSPVPRWTLGTIGSWRMDRERQDVSASRGDLRAEWRASPRVTLSGGVWNERQRDPGLARGTISYWGSIVRIELAPNARL